MEIRAKTNQREGIVMRILDKEQAIIGLDALGIRDPRQVGRLVGDVMRTHRGQVEAADVKRAAEELLREGGPDAR